MVVVVIRIVVVAGRSWFGVMFGPGLAGVAAESLMGFCVDVDLGWEIATGAPASAFVPVVSAALRVEIYVVARIIIVVVIGSPANAGFATGEY